MTKITVKDIDVEGKRVLVRVDFNVPIDSNGFITDKKRLKSSIPTILYLLKKGGRVILMSHLGRPCGKKLNRLSLKPCVSVLSDLLGGIDVIFLNDCIGDDVRKVVNSLSNGQIVLLENLRFYIEEIKNDLNFARELSRIADVYVNDAFGVIHRKHASVEGITHFVNISIMGLLLAKEIFYINCIFNNAERMFVAILGGSKVSDKISVIDNLIDKVDLLILGGAMIFTFLKAKGLKIGESLFEKDSVDFAHEMMKKYEKKLLLPIDCLVTDSLDLKSKTIGKTKYVDINLIENGWYGIDIGLKTVKYISDILFFSRTIVWNGPVGIFEIEESSTGTFSLAKAVGCATSNGAMSVVGGGDSALALKKAGSSHIISHVSTGGGALLRFMEGNSIPGFSSLIEQ